MSNDSDAEEYRKILDQQQKDREALYAIQDQLEKDEALKQAWKAAEQQGRT